MIRIIYQALSLHVTYLRLDSKEYVRGRDMCFLRYDNMRDFCALWLRSVVFLSKSYISFVKRISYFHQIVRCKLYLPSASIVRRSESFRPFEESVYRVQSLR